MHFFFLPLPAARRVIGTLLVLGAALQHAAADNLLYNASGQLTTVTTSGAVAAPVIVAHPSSAVLESGQPFALAVNATGSGLAYQWYKDTQLVPGATSATLFFAAVDGTTPGSYSVTVTNSGGSVPSNAAVLSFPPNPFTAPMGNVGVDWASSGTTLWHVITDPAQTRESGNPVIGTGRAFEDDSDLQATFTVTAATTLRYWMRLPGPSEPEEFSGQLHPCHVDVELNGVTAVAINEYENGGVWKQYQLHLADPGTYTLRWHHTSNGYVLVDDVTLTNAPDTDMDGLSDDWETEMLGDLNSGATDDPDNDHNSNLAEYHDRTNPVSYYSRQAHLFIVVHGNGQVVNSQPEPAGGYSLNAQTLLELTAVPAAGHTLVAWQRTDVYGSPDIFFHPLPVEFYGESATIHAWFEPTLTLAEGADTTTVTWTTSPAAPWFTQSRITSDGSDALMNGMTLAVADQTSWVEGSFTGPARLSFDYLIPYDGTFALTVDGLNIPWSTPYDQLWHQHTISLSPGPHTVRWTRTTPSYVSSSTSFAALDKVVVTPQTDSDNDGMTDEWEIEHFGSLARDGTGDFDDDGVSDLNEHHDLTDPTQQYDLRARLQVNVIGSGSVALSPQRTSYRQGDTVVATATPAAGWELLEWTGVYNPTTNPLPITMYNPSTTLTARFIPVGGLNEALDNAAQVFANSLPGWTKTTAVSHDGVDAAQAPAVTTSVPHSFTADLDGPHVVAFWWRLERNPSSWSQLTFQDAASGSPLSYPEDATGWRRVIVQLPPGQHSLSWAFSCGDPGVDNGSNAWIDQVMIGADTDEDGLPDAWEITNFGSIAATTGTADSDNDDNSNQTEWADGTNPNDAASALYRLAITADRTDSVAVSPLQEVYLPGTQVALMADPSFTAWSGSATGSTNPLTVTMNANKTIHADFQPLSRAVDNTKLLFQSGPGNPWQITSEEMGWGYEGNDAAVTPPDLAQGQTSTMQTTLTTGGRLSFKARGAFAPDNGAVFRWLLDGAEVGRHTLGYWNVMDVSFIVPPGTHIVQWIYTQGSDDPQMSPGASVDAVVWTPMNLLPPEEALDAPGTTWTYGSSAVPTWLGLSTTTYDGVDAMEVVEIGHSSTASLETTINPTASSVVSFWWKVSSEEDFDFLRFFLDDVEVDNAVAISGDQDWGKVSFVVPAGSHTLRWTYSKDTYGTGGQDRAWVDQLAVQPVQTFPLSEALDNPTLSWTTSSAAPWTGGNLQTHDGADAAQSADLPDTLGTSWVQTSVTGPGTLTFWWKVSCEPNWAVHRFLVDGGAAIPAITGEVGWTQVTVSIPAGSHTLRWSYDKNNAFPIGADKAWVDEVVFSSASPGFGGWASSFGYSGADAQPTANPMKDGISNLLKYAFNLSPNTSIQGAARHLEPGTGTSGLPATTTTGATGSKRLRLEYVRRRNATDISYTAQFGSGLNPSDWSTATGTETVTAIDADWERVVIEDTVTSGTSSRRFARVLVTQNP